MDEYEDERACETAGREAKAGKGRPLKQTKVTDVFAGKKLRVRRAAGASADGAQGDKKRKADAPAPVQKASREEAPDDDGDASPRLNADDAAQAGPTKQGGGDLDEGAALLQFLASDMMAMAQPEKSKPAGRNNTNASCAGTSQVEATVITPPDSGEGWAWEPSCHNGLLTYHDGRKRWYHCTQCKYFNDRLYHSKMHYQRIHVNQGKSMPRKRKYMEPAGTSMVAGEAACLPPQHVQQPEPKYSRTRQPGDKWLKTVANKDAASSGFRYQSVKDLSGLKQEDDSAATNSDDEELLERASTPSNECVASSAEREQRERELGLSAPEKQLYCWEMKDNIQRGVDKAKIPRKFKVVYTFQTQLDAPAPPANAPAHSAAAALQRPGPLAALSVNTLAARSKHQTWWWHNPRLREGAGNEDEDTESDGSPPPSTTDGLLAGHMLKASEKLEATSASPDQPLRQRVAKPVTAVPLHFDEATYNGHEPSSSQETVDACRQEEVVASLTAIALAAARVSAAPLVPRVRAGQSTAEEEVAADAAVHADGGRKKSGAKETKTSKAEALKAKSAGSKAAEELQAAPAAGASGMVLTATATIASSMLAAAAVCSPQARETRSSTDDGAADAGKVGVGKRKGPAAAVPPTCAGVGASGQAGGGAAATGPASAHGKKRVWKRWCPAEEAELQRAVEKHGTKDWTAIVQEMQTERSVKQLQDHWNDTKKK